MLHCLILGGVQALHLPCGAFSENPKAGLFAVAAIGYDFARAVGQRFALSSPPARRAARRQAFKGYLRACGSVASQPPRFGGYARSVARVYEGAIRGLCRVER